MVSVCPRQHYKFTQMNITFSAWVHYINKFLKVILHIHMHV